MRLNLTFSQTEQKLNLAFAKTEQLIKLSFGQIIKVTDADPFEGPYEFTPTAEGFVIDCEKKLMLEDVTINQIPYHEVTNPHGGLTVSIAS